MSTEQPKPVTPSGQRRCPECGGVLVDGATSCWLCLAKVPDASGSVPLRQTVVPHAASDFSHSSLMMFVTLVCVVLGVFSIARGWGSILAFIAFFAWTRTVIKIRRRSATEPAQTTSEKIALFFQSVASVIMIIGLVLLAGFAALFIACWVMLSGGHI